MFKLSRLLPFLAVSCLDYQDINTAGINSPPLIDKAHVTPSPTDLLQHINIGRYCHAKEFMIPPIYDSNLNDDLYFLWFIKDPSNNREYALQPIDSIKSESRNKTITTLLIERRMLENAFGGTLPSNFFNNTYFIGFFVSDRPYLIPENRYLGLQAFEDSFYWVTTFVDNKC